MSQNISLEKLNLSQNILNLNQNMSNVSQNIYMGRLNLKQNMSMSQNISLGRLNLDQYLSNMSQNNFWGTLEPRPKLILSHPHPLGPGEMFSGTFGPKPKQISSLFKITLAGLICQLLRQYELRQCPQRFSLKPEWPENLFQNINISQGNQEWRRQY